MCCAKSKVQRRQPTYERCLFLQAGFWQTQPMTTSKSTGNEGPRSVARRARTSPSVSRQKPPAQANRAHAPVSGAAGPDDTDRPAAQPSAARSRMPDVGVNLRLLREERSLTLQDLSDRSGVSKAMLNQIEAGKSSPTIALGWKIANGLGVPFGALLGEAMPGDFLVHPRDQVQVLYSEDRRLCTRALFPPGEPRAAELYELCLEPGASEDAQSHTAGTREQIYVTAGQLVVETEDHRAELEAGDVLFFCADRPHRYHNPGRSTARFVMAMLYPAPRRRATP